jgi:hypothetical protein
LQERNSDDRYLATYIPFAFAGSQARSLGKIPAAEATLLGPQLSARIRVEVWLSSLSPAMSDRTLTS